ncbi:MAG: hypothetical protein FWD57_00815 [Polyangiaceae bacterium]|nr:hypothetical protein [Polyangiaceae bacterium]
MSGTIFAMLTFRVASYLMRIAICGAVLTATCALSCKRSSTPPAPAAASSSSVAPKPDRLAPGELAPGKETAFGLPIPGNLKAVRREPFLIQYEGRVQPERVANYVRDHLDEQSAAKPQQVHSAMTIFDRVIAKGSREPLLRIEVVAIARGTRLIIQDLTPRKAKLLTREEAWKEEGFDSQGKKFDPNKFE